MGEGKEDFCFFYSTPIFPKPINLFFFQQNLKIYEDINLEPGKIVLHVLDLVLW